MKRGREGADRDRRVSVVGTVVSSRTVTQATCDTRQPPL